MSPQATTIIGGGLVGLAVALGLRDRGHEVTVLDGRERDLRASVGNFGLVWLQGKGARNPAYANWTLEAVSAWPALARTLRERSGIDVALDQRGGYEFFTEETEFEKFAEDLARQSSHLGNRFSCEALPRRALVQRLPGIGRKVVGATFCPHDGHVNPLRLYRALGNAAAHAGVRIERGWTVERVTADGDRSFHIDAADGRQVTTSRVVLCAGLESARLGPQLGFGADIRPQRGELLITEKTGDRLPFLSSTIRQVDEGGIQIGGTKDESGPDDRETAVRMADLARHAVAVWPALANVRVVRSWGALRVMTRDGYPIYARSSRHPEAILVTCHSGVTLASMHATRLAEWIDGDPAAPDLEAFDERRFALS